MDVKFKILAPDGSDLPFVEGVENIRKTAFLFVAIALISASAFYGGSVEPNELNELIEKAEQGNVNGQALLACATRMKKNCQG